MRTYDEELLELAKQAPGFGGMAFDADGGATVFVTDLAQASLVGPVVSAFLRDRVRDDDVSRQANGAAPILRFVKGEFDWAALKSWKDQLRAAVFSDPAVSFLDADEGKNRVTIGIETASAEARIREIARSKGAPDGLLRFVVEAKPTARATLSSAFAPRIGGLQIEVPGGICTLGLIASWNYTGDRTILTNSHCSGTRFENNSVSISQGNQIIGSEVSDPPLFQVYAGCPADRWCRFSDLAVFDIADGSSVSDYGIAFTGLTNSPCTNQSCGAQVTIKGKVVVVETTYSIQGQTLNKTGRTTGWTRGTVTNTCADTPTDALNYPPAGGLIEPLFLCQIHTTIWSEPGDSGSPVYQRFTEVSGTPGEAAVHGIMWGGPGSNFNVTWVSPFSGMGFDVGPLIVHF